MPFTSLGAAHGFVVLYTTRGRRHNEFFLLQSLGSVIFIIVYRRGEETAKVQKKKTKYLYALRQHSI
jgi:hypothetical protein